MKIKMLRNAMGSEDGHTVKHYEAEKTYDVCDDLANSFIGEKIAEPAKEQKSEAAPENKAVAKAPKNKAEAAPETSSVDNLKAYTLVTAPATEPVSLADVKTFLRIDGTADDAILTTLIASARRMAEEYTKRAFITQTWKLTMDRFSEWEDDSLPPGYYTAPTPFLVNGTQAIQLSRQPIQSITHIKTTDTANAQSTVTTATYTLDTATGQILLNEGYSWPSDLRSRAAVEIQFTAGWLNAATVPDPIKAGIMQHVATSYTNKVCADIPAGSKALYDAFRLPEAFGAC